MHRNQPRATIGVQRKTGVLHPDRSEDMLGKEVAEPLPARPFDRLANPVDVDAVAPSLGSKTSGNISAAF